MDVSELDIPWVRERFPALRESLAFFDNAGGTVACSEVIERVHEHVERSMVQLGGTHPWSVDATERVQAGHAAAATLINARPGEVALTPSTTVSMKRLATALAPSLSPGDEVVVTNLDHEANVGAFRHLGEGPYARDGVRVREWSFDPERQMLTEEGLREVLTDRTRLVAFTHCSNVVGAFHDVRRLAAVARETGAWVVVDGVAFAPHRRVDVQALGVDAYGLSLYKVYGPHLGALWVGECLREHLSSQNHFFLPADDVSSLLEPGAVSHELAVAVPGIVSYLESFAEHHGARALEGAFERIAAHEESLVAPLLDYLTSRQDVRVLGPAVADRAVRAPTVAFSIEGADPAAVARRLDDRGVLIRTGHFYARRAVEAMGLLGRGGVLRASMAHYNTVAEVQRLVEALDDALERSTAAR